MRNGNAKQIMSLSKEHTTALWNAVQDSTCHALSYLPTLSHFIHRPTFREARLHTAAALLSLFVHLLRRSDLPLPTPPRLESSSIMASCTSPTST